jgi:predicted Zn finger-like uncharacterized protein
MQIPCVSCQSLFRLDSGLVKATGSLVRCSKCEYIFMVYPPTLNDKPTVKDTNIDQSILFDLFKVERTNRANGIHNQTTDVLKSHRADEIASINDFEEEEDGQASTDGSLDYSDLPDLSEYEDIIDWDESADADDLTEQEKQFYNSIQDLDINES